MNLNRRIYQVKIVYLCFPEVYFEFLFAAQTDFRYLLLNCTTVDTLLNDSNNYLSLKKNLMDAPPLAVEP